MSDRWRARIDLQLQYRVLQTVWLEPCDTMLADRNYFIEDGSPR
jgi:hypothetical protein